MKIHKAEQRGYADHGWLKSHHSFSFANYYNPEMMGVGLLRVLNDDYVAPGMGFGTHSHQDMEIISIPLKGSLKHKDTMGNETIITDHEVQTMSAGSGVSHSEFNASTTDAVNFLQIWILTRDKGVEPHYSQKSFPISERKNKWQLLVSNNERENSVKIFQDAFISRAQLDENSEVDYSFYNQENLGYLFLISGRVQVNTHDLNQRDAAIIEAGDGTSIKAKKDSDLLFIEVPR